MAWTLVGKTEFTVSDGTGTEAKTLPGTPAANDIVLLLLGSDRILDSGTSNSGGVVSTEGYTILADDITSTEPGYQLSYKVMGATPDTDVDINQQNVPAAAVQAGILQVWRGGDASTPIDNSISEDTGAAGDPDPPSHTTLTDGALRIVVGVLDDDNAETGLTAPSGYTDLSAKEAGASAGSSNTVMMASKEAATAGAENPAAFSTPGSDAWWAGHFALRPGEVSRGERGIGRGVMRGVARGI
ncbi:MAG: hypothetical protein QNJ92_17365 [Alphaproteobacteria bacterium]|nr:hypothetical protein [Alphaproteobacteria bacterium]